MTTDKEAIEKAAEYLKSLSNELSDNLLDHPERIRLESVQQLNDGWVIMLSYLPKSTNGQSGWDKVLEGVRRFKEFNVNSNGKVTAMKDPTLA